MSSFNFNPNFGMPPGAGQRPGLTSLNELLAPWQSVGLAQQQNLSLRKLFQQLMQFQNQGFGKSYGELGKALGEFNTFGKQAKGDIRRTGIGERRGITSSLAGRGLSNTTTLDSLHQGSRESQQRSVLGVDEAVSRGRAGVRSAMSGLRERQTAAQSGTLGGQIGSMQKIYQQLAQMIQQWEQQRSDNTNRGFGPSFRNAFGGALGGTLGEGIGDFGISGLGAI